MTETSYRRIIDRLDRVRETGNGATALCPAHPDRNPSLSITKTEGRTLVYCHAGCDAGAVVDALDLTMADLFDEPFHHDRYGTVVATYTYPGGREVWRTADKQFPQPNRAKNGDTSLYHVDRIAGADTVYVVEGEEDVHAVEAAGGSAVCPAMGAGKAHKFDWSPLAGKHVVVVADRDKAGRKHAADIVQLVEPIAARVRTVEAAVGKDASDHIAAEKSLTEFRPVDPDPPAVSLISLADVKPERVEWLWRGYLPKGKLVTLDGDPGLGKSTLALSLAAPVTAGGLWPDGSKCDHPGAVLLLSAEDGLADTVRPRLDAAGADVTKVHAVEGVTVADKEGNRGLRPPTVGDIAQLRSAIMETGAVLVVIDVLMAFMPTGSDAHKDQDVRAILSRLTRLAEETGCTVVLIRHLNKSAGRDPLYRGGGSIGIVGAGRLALLVAADPDDEGRRVLAAMKSNLGPLPDAMAYRLVTADGGYDVARVEWEGRVDHTAHTLLADRPSGSDAQARTEAEAWLQDYLKQHGATRAGDVKRDAKRDGIAQRTLERAAEKIGVKKESWGYPRVTYWALPGVEETTPDAPNGGETGETEADLRKQDGETGRKPQSRQPLRDGETVVPGGPTETTPGMTPAVERALAAARTAGRFTADPPCYHCDRPVVSKHQDGAGRYVHHECERVYAPTPNPQVGQGGGRNR